VKIAEQLIVSWIELKEGPRYLLILLGSRLRRNWIKKGTPLFRVPFRFPRTRSGKVQKIKLAGMAQKEYLDG
jgi:hypothetical protein